MDKLKSIVRTLSIRLRDFAITGKEKAVAAFIASTVTTYMAENNLTWHGLLHWSALWALCVGVGTHAVVYFTSNSGQRS